MKNLKFIIFFCNSVIALHGTAQQQESFDSLYAKIAPFEGKERVEKLHDLIIKTWLNYPREAINYAKESILLSDSIDDQRLHSKSIRLKGGVHYYLGNYDSALIYSRRSLDIATSINDTSLVNSSLNNTGLVYYNLGSYQNALENLLRSLNLKKATGEIYGRAQTINNIGLVYNKLKDFKRARKYFFEALDFSKKHQDRNLQLYSLNNIGTTYILQDNLDEALKYFKSANALRVDNKNWNAVTMSGMGQIYQKKRKFAESQKYFDQSMTLRNEIGDKNGISEMYFFYAKGAQVRQIYDSALFYLNKSQKIATEIGSKDRMFENFELYVDLYEELNNTDKAFEYQTLLLGLRDTLFNENMARNLSDIQLKLQKEESQALLSSKDKEIDEGKKFATFLVVIILLAIVILVVILLALRHNRKTNRLLESQNIEISEQKEEIMQQKEDLLDKNIALQKAQILIKEQNEKLEVYNEQLLHTVDKRTQELKERNEELNMANLELDNFIYKSSHDIKGPLATLMGVCNVALMDVKDGESKKYFEMLAKTSAGLNDILARLKTVSDISSRELKVKKIKFEEIFEKCIDQVKKIEGIEQIKVSYTIDKEVSYEGDPVLIDLIVFNMIHNAIKFKEERGEDLIKIQVTEKDKSVIMHFVDNGIGIEEEDAESIFHMYTKSALKHQSLGLGLYLVKQCVQKLGGEIMLMSNEENLTHFRISLPKF